MVVCIMSNHINWKKAVEEYKENYEDDDGIHEYIDGLVPHYYYDISNAFLNFTAPIEASDVGADIATVMVRHIFDAYYESFMEEWTPFEEA